MARPMNSAKQTAGGEPMYDVDPVSGATIEVFYADQASAPCFGVSSAGWLWWSHGHGCLSDAAAAGPFATKYAAYRDALRNDCTTSARWTFGNRARCARAMR